MNVMAYAFRWDSGRGDASPQRPILDSGLGSDETLRGLMIIRDASPLQKTVRMDV